MSRKIKFRAWIVDHGQTPPKGKMYYAIADFHSNGKLLEYFEDRCCDDEDSLMQYTGLKDKKGVEIYEGDVLQGLHGKYPVFWNTEKAAFEARIVGFAGMQAGNWKEREVIGNVHQHPGLLAAENQESDGEDNG